MLKKKDNKRTIIREEFLRVFLARCLLSISFLFCFYISLLKPMADGWIKQIRDCSVKFFHLLFVQALANVSVYVTTTGWTFIVVY